MTSLLPRARLRALAVLLVAAGALGVYLLLPSSAPNPDGLRVFPGLHDVQAPADGGLTWQPLRWDAGYRLPNYFRANVQKHFLFPLHAWLSYRAALRLGCAGSGLRVMQVANAVSAALVLVLFGLLLASMFESAWVAPAATLGLAFSTAFGTMATNIAEVVPALPWMVLGLILVRLSVARAKPGSNVSAWRGPAAWGGVALGVSAAFYLASGLIGVALALGLVITRRYRAGIVLLLTMAFSTLAIYAGVLTLAGYQGLGAVWHAVTYMPELGTYGGFRLTNLVAVLFGFANSLFPVLPAEFAGLRQGAASLLAHDRGSYLRLIALPLVWGLALAFVAGLLRVRGGPEPAPQRGVLIGLAVFSGALLASLVWGPYHEKLWAYSNVGAWLMAASLAEYELRFRDRLRVLVLSLLTVAVSTTLATNLSNLIRQHRPNPKWGAAMEVARRVLDGSAADGSNRLVIGGWEPEFGYLTLMVPESSLLSLPDAYLENGASSERFRRVADERISRVFAKKGKVFFVNLFGRDTAEIRRAYVDRLRFPKFVAWLDGFRPLIRLVWRDARTGIDLFELVDTSELRSFGDTLRIRFRSASRSSRTRLNSARPFDTRGRLSVVARADSQAEPLASYVPFQIADSRF